MCGKVKPYGYPTGALRNDQFHCYKYTFGVYYEHGDIQTADINNRIGVQKMSKSDLMAVVTASTVNNLLNGSLQGKVAWLCLPTEEDPQSVLNAEVSMEDYLGIAEEVSATVDQVQLVPNGRGHYLNLWITSPERANKDAWFGDKGLVLVSAWEEKQNETG